MIQESPYCLCVLGPNGSGKTTIMRNLEQEGLRVQRQTFPVPEYFINPDQVALDLVKEFPDQSARNRAAFDKGIALRREAMDKHLAFAFESVFSHPSRVAEIELLRKKGYKILLICVATNDVELHVERVELRFKTKSTTGHFVPANTVRDRYARVMRLLPSAAEHADVMFVYDNTSDYESPILEVTVDGQEVSVLMNKPQPWVRRYLLHPLQTRAQEVKALYDFCEGAGMSMVNAEIMGASYCGLVARSTDNFILQDIGAHHYVLHDRALLDTAPESHPLRIIPDYRVGENFEIVYELEKAPVVHRVLRDRF